MCHACSWSFTAAQCSFSDCHGGYSYRQTSSSWVLVLRQDRDMRPGNYMGRMLMGKAFGVLLLVCREPGCSQDPHGCCGQAWMSKAKKKLVGRGSSISIPCALSLLSLSFPHSCPAYAPQAACMTWVPSSWSWSPETGASVALPCPPMPGKILTDLCARRISTHVAHECFSSALGP